MNATNTERKKGRQKERHTATHQGTTTEIAKAQTNTRNTEIHNERPINRQDEHKYRKT